MNKQIILNKHLNGVEVGNSNESMLNAMTEFAKQYHKEQLILYGVSQQRELLKGYAQLVQSDYTNHFFDDAVEESIDQFLSL